MSRVRVGPFLDVASVLLSSNRNGRRLTPRPKNLKKGDVLMISGAADRRAAISQPGRRALAGSLLLTTALTGFAHAAEPLCFSNPTNNTSGVNLALASAEVSTSQTLEVLAERRTANQQNCPEGFERDGGLCRRAVIAAANVPPPPAPAQPAPAAQATQSPPAAQPAPPKPQKAQTATPSQSAVSAAPPKPQPKKPVSSPADAAVSAPVAKQTQQAPPPVEKKAPIVARKPSIPLVEPVRDTSAKDVARGDMGAGSPRLEGSYGEFFADYERRTGVSRTTQKTAGFIGGYDRAFSYDGSQARVGILGGYTHINQKSNSANTSSNYDIVLNNPGGQIAPGFIVPASQRQFTVSGLDREIIDRLERKFSGGTLGFSGSLSKGNFFSDSVVKVDHYQIDQARVTSNSRGQFNGSANIPGDNTAERYDINGALIPFNTTFMGRPAYTTSNACITPAGGLNPDGMGVNNQAQRRAAIAAATNQFQPTTTSSNNDTSLTNFIVGNVSGFSYKLGDGWTLDPFVGTQMTVAHYGNNADQLGLRDGFALRLEGGTRIGHLSVFENGVNWVNSARLSVYSDVIVNGFVVGSAGSSDATDEGKVRGRGAFESRILFPNGVSLFGEVNGRVGEDYWAVGGKLGGRVEW
jgi:outer membrane biosynthesis protein TonB